MLSGRWGRGPHAGGFGGTVGSDPLVQSALGASLLWVLAMAVCRQEPTCWTGSAGRRASSLPAGLISSLLTNPFTLEQAERGRAQPEASQCHSSPATTVSLLGAHRAPIYLPGWGVVWRDAPHLSPSTPPRCPHNPSTRSPTRHGSSPEPGNAAGICALIFSPGLQIASVAALRARFQGGCSSRVRELWHGSHSTA